MKIGMVEYESQLIIKLQLDIYEQVQTFCLCRLVVTYREDRHVCEIIRVLKPTDPKNIICCKKKSYFTKN